MRLAMFAVSFVLAAGPFATPAAEAARGDVRASAQSASRLATSRPAASGPAASRQPPRTSARRDTGRASFSGGISCVPYARAITGMDIRGNGRDWWHSAAGRYHRSQRPVEGSVLSFPGSGSMPMGHVAVVSRVVHGRLVEIDHANWGGPGIRRGMVMRDVRVMDVSPDNSWTRVRVQVGFDRDSFGREYPTHGFIHNRPAGTAYADGAGPDGLLHRASAVTRSVQPAPRRAAAAQQPRRPAAQSAPRVAQARR